MQISNILLMYFIHSFYMLFEFFRFDLQAMHLFLFIFKTFIHISFFCVKIFVNYFQMLDFLTQILNSLLKLYFLSRKLVSESFKLFFLYYNWWFNWSVIYIIYCTGIYMGICICTRIIVVSIVVYWLLWVIFWI